MPTKNQRRGRPRGRGLKRVSSMALWNKFNSRLSSERKTTIIRLTTGPGAYSATAGGVISGTIVCDPSVTTYTEGKSIQALYSSMRLIAAKISISPESGNTTKRSVWFGSFLGTGLVTPTSYAQVADNANVLKYANIANDNTGRVKQLALGADKGILFQEWQTASTDNSGAPGGFYYYGDGFTASQPVMLLELESIFECRNRV